MKKIISLLLVLAMTLSLLPAVTAAEDSVDFAVLSTTDMHGKCWDKNILTEANENNNMLRVSTAVQEYRENYGDNLLVIDNGDLYQGTPVSVVQLGKITSGESDLPPAMALCLGDIGYDASVLGNHEFNYPWTTMTKAYDYLAGRGVPVITANLYYDGSDGVHERGENVFTPYLVKTFTLNGTEHKIGVLGFENTDCTRWDVPANYPGIVFAHPDNTDLSMAWEAQRYIPQMQAEGCEFIIVSYHSGTGSATGELVFGQNTEGQVTRMIAECEGIDMVIAGHDHSSAYSNTYLKDKNGKDVLVVNGGGQQLTSSVFSFSLDGEGKLTYTVKDTRNLNLSGWAVDTALKAKIQPYADMAEEYVNQTAGTAVGTWDTSSNYYLEQTDTMDLINGAQIDYGTKYMAQKYDTAEKQAALFAATGLDHIEVDMSSTSAVTNNNYYVHPGPISMKTIIQMYRFDNNVLYLLPLTGQQIKDVLEQNASTRLKAVVRNGAVSYQTIGENFTNPVFGGLNFTYDMYQPAGSRAVITGFSNGRAFELDKTYVVACNSYHLGNPGCGFGNYTTSDSVWNQNDDLAGGNVQEVLLEYIRDKGEISTEPFTWEWKLDYTGDLDAPTELVGDFAAQKVTDPASLETGDRIVIYYDAEGTVIGTEPAADARRLAAVDATVQGDYVAAANNAAIFEIEWIEGTENRFRLKAEQGYLTAGATGNSLGFSETAQETDENDCTAWYLAPAEGGYHIMSVGAAYNDSHNQAIEWYSGFTTYGVKDTAVYLFNLYQIAETANRVSELTDGKQYAIYYDEEGLSLADTENSGGLGSVTNTVSGPFLMLPAAEHTLIVTAHVNEAGQIDFETADGLHLTAGKTGNSLKLTEELDPDDCSLWTPVPVEGGFHVMNVGASYNGNHNQALEYYGGKFTTYGVKDSGAYLFNFYELPETEEPDPCADGHSWDEGVETAAPTCTLPGVKQYTCTVCGETRTETVPALGHDWDEGVVTLEPTVTAEGERTYTCRRCGETRIEPIEKIPFLFNDVKDPSKFYYEPVYWAFFHDPQITTGTSDTMFSPGKVCTRGQVVTFLWRALGCPEPAETSHSFTDVKPSAYYYQAMLWAVEAGVTTGTSATTFGPNKEATRGQVVTFLWRALGEPEPTQTSHPFTDVKESGYYFKAMLWAVETGVTSGTSKTTFGPNKTATRGHVVTFLYRAVGPVRQKIALVSEESVEEPINAAVWAGITAYCEAYGAECGVYTTDESVEDLRVKVTQAVEEGCNTVLLPGAFYGELLAWAQEEYPDVRFVGLDFTGEDVGPMDGDPVPLGKNTVCLNFREEQAGYLAGYAAVKLGFRKLGVLAGMEIPAVQRYGFGFIQGADQAARELGVQSQVSVRHIYSGTFWPTEEAEQQMGRWYGEGIEAVFSCGGNVWQSLIEPAKTNGGKIIGVDVDQAADIDEAVGAGTCVTSAMKDFEAAARYILTEIGEKRWEDFGGGSWTLGVEKAGCFLGLPASTQWAAGFSEEAYQELCTKLITEDLTVSADTTAPATEIKVVYEGAIQYPED